MSVTVLQPGSSAMMRGLAARVDVAARADAVSGAILATVFPGRAGDAAFVAALGDCSRENVTSVMGVLAGRLALTDVRADCARDFAELVARLGIPLADLERAYWVGVERLWQDWFDLCRGASAEGRGELPDLLGGSTSLLFGYVDAVLARVVARHTEVAEEMAASCEDRRRELVARLLDPVPSPDTERGEAAEALLGYRLRSHHHVALLLRGPEREVRRALEALREASGARGSLLVRVDGGAWHGWLGHLRAPDADAREALRRAAADTGLPVTVGEPSSGPDGFRRSHQGARDTERLRGVLRRPGGCLETRRLRLESLLLADPDAARRFARDELGELAGDTDRDLRIRETLLCWLDTGSHTRAAAELGVHENTVRMRVRVAGQQLGPALAERRTELLVALRLRAVLGPGRRSVAPEVTSDQ